jgi:hypothetical protein
MKSSIQAATVSLLMLSSLTASTRTAAEGNNLTKTDHLPPLPLPLRRAITQISWTATTRLRRSCGTTYKEADATEAVAALEENNRPLNKEHK